MKLFVTGATGFIGLQTARKLLDLGHDVHCLVRESSDVKGLQEMGVTLTTGDVTDKPSLVAGMQGCEAVIHLANLYSYWEPRKEIYQQVNIDGTRYVMEAALETGQSKVIHVSSIVAYGASPDRPFTEESPVGEHLSEYARTKYEGDRIAWQLYADNQLPLVMVYPGGVLGPNDPKSTGDYIKRLIQGQLPIRAMEDCVVTFVHVDDVAEIIVRALLTQGNIGEKYIAGKEQITWGQLNTMVSEIAGVSLPRVAVPNFVVRFNSVLATFIADLTKRPPMHGLAKDAIRSSLAGLCADGSKAERELGITYTPVRIALEECVASFTS